MWDYLAKLLTTFDELQVIAKQSSVGPSGSDAWHSQTWLHKTMQKVASTG